MSTPRNPTPNKRHPDGIYGFHGDYRPLSNFHYVRVVFEGQAYPTVEHAYQAAKTLDLDRRKLIAIARSPGEAKRMGKSVVLRDDWDDVKLPIMLELQIQKYSQADMADFLLWTGDRYIEETNVWNDRYWGVCRGRGENQLGKMLMMLREWLR